MHFCFIHLIVLNVAAVQTCNNVKTYLFNVLVKTNFFEELTLNINILVYSFLLRFWTALLKSCRWNDTFHVFIGKSECQMYYNCNNNIKLQHFAFCLAEKSIDRKHSYIAQSVMPSWSVFMIRVLLALQGTAYHVKVNHLCQAFYLHCFYEIQLTLPMFMLNGINSIKH